jgi:prepilin signal peptidase PulO-like enzyme (type II secretory pathway)
MRRESVVYGRGFWVRPMLVELLSGGLFAWLYWWETAQLGLLPPIQQFAALAGGYNYLMATVHWQCLVHLVLLAFMVLATLIDLDEKIIPDGITVPGTTLGLLLAAQVPFCHLPHVWMLPNGQPVFDLVRLTSPNAWPAWLNGPAGLAIGLACWAAWCFALLPRTWYTRHGLRRAVALCAARLWRQRTTYLILALAVLGAVGISLVWRLDDRDWEGLLTGLVGMAAAGGLVWAVRGIGYFALRREAMGFGDVTLMAMLGAFLGWQASLIVFFVAPLFALVVGIVQLLTRRDEEVPYGPFLCLAALAVVASWQSVWSYCQVYFGMELLVPQGWFVPLMVVVCLALMLPLLILLRGIRQALARPRTTP